MLSPYEQDISYAVQAGYAVGVTSSGQLVGLPSGTPAPEPLAVLFQGVVSNISELNAAPAFGVATSGNVYVYNGDSFAPAGNVGFSGVISGIAAAAVVGLKDTPYPPPNSAQIAPIVIGASGNIAIMVSYSSQTGMTTWAPLTLTPAPNGDDLIGIYS